MLICFGCSRFDTDHDCDGQMDGRMDGETNGRFYELGLTRDSRVIPGLTAVSVLSTSNLGLNWD